MNVQLSGEAERDLLNGVAFYDGGDRHAGDHFLESLTTDLRSLSFLGGVHAMRHGYHCMSASRFPFAIYYAVDSGSIFVIAILDERRDPGWIANRLQLG
ncbi:hypothetical protein Poly24_50030 [Rosistilla carotiformis]|uniref:Plasmid stabilization system protein n=1 Tax=Rosistilla carotiformis TaxID=2528017 RepID=A0A518K0F5_9BACT|nr:type II toxin-antitoxin system RelE/ParE family toxin [Rosistilla carotiformis]QDV71268.1 hypothetical protein Poly24_50030 [Rosistilla carotiformis]